MTTTKKVVIISSSVAVVGFLTWYLLLRKKDAVKPADKVVLKSTVVTPDNTVTATAITNENDKPAYVTSDGSYNQNLAEDMQILDTPLDSNGNEQVLGS